VDEAVDGDGEEKDTSCSPESSGRTGRRLARLDGVVGLLLLRLRTGSWRFNGDRRL
jgi:hypothetical protein